MSKRFPNPFKPEFDALHGFYEVQIRSNLTPLMQTSSSISTNMSKLKLSSSLLSSLPNLASQLSLNKAARTSNVYNPAFPYLPIPSALLEARERSNMVLRAPQRMQLRAKVQKRCKACSHVLLKPDSKSHAAKFKMKLLAL